MLGIGKCRVAAGAYDFFWRDEQARDVQTFKELGMALIKRFVAEPRSVKLRRFSDASQKQGEDVLSYATKIQARVRATLHGDSLEQPSSQNDAREKIAFELMRE